MSENNSCSIIFYYYSHRKGHKRPWGKRKWLCPVTVHNSISNIFSFKSLRFLLMYLAHLIYAPGNEVLLLYIFLCHSEAWRLTDRTTSPFWFDCRLTPNRSNYTSSSKWFWTRSFNWAQKKNKKDSWAHTVEQLATSGRWWKYRFYTTCE